MTKNLTTKNSMLISALALLLCFALLIGTTFAWFTDSVTSANNIIVSGNLDITLEYWNGSEWKDVAGSSEILDQDALWEPGYTEIAYLRVKNAGSLSLKYQLGVNIISETKGVNAAGEEFTLSDYIYFDVVEGVNGQDAGYATREAAMAVATETTKISDGYSKAGALLPGSDYVHLAMVIYMPTSVGNEANHNGKTIPEILLGINVFATQYTAEDDSFGNDYDAGSPWTGAIDPDWYFENTDATTFEINTAEQLAALAAIVNGEIAAPTATYAANATANVQDSFKGKTIVLTGDIDLYGRTWAPIGNWDNAFAGTFDGNGYTISNLYVNAPLEQGLGLFGVTEKVTFKNLTIKNVEISGYDRVAAVVGYASPGSTFTNCHVAGDIKLTAEWAYVGGISSYGYISFEGCSVIADEVGYITSTTRNGVGGICGWLCEGNNTLTNCQVKNLVLTGWTNVGGLTGFAHYKNVIDGCSVENVVLNKTRVDGHPGIGLAAGGWSYNATNPVTITNNSFNNVTINGSAINYASADILYGSEYAGNLSSNFVLENNTQTNITNNLVLMEKPASTTDLKNVLADDTVVYLPAGEYTLPSLTSYKNLTIVGADGVSVTPVNSFNFGENTTIKNVTINAASGSAIRYGYANGNVTFENCEFMAKMWAVHFDGANGALITFNNCVFKNRVALAADGSYLFNDCTFKYQYSNYNTINVYSVATFNNCKWDSKLELSLADGAKVIIDGDEITENVYFISNMSALESFRSKVNSGSADFVNKYVMLSADLDMNDGYYKTWTPIGQTGKGQFQGTFDGHGYTISNMKVDSSKQTDKYYSSGFFGWTLGAVVKNVTFKNASVIGNHNVGVVAGYLEYTGSTISNCKVIDSTITATHIDDDVCGDKVGVIVGHAGNSGVKVENCSATNCTVTAGRDAGQIAGAALSANVIGCTATNVTVTADGSCTGANVKEEVIGRVLG